HSIPYLAYDGYRALFLLQAVAPDQLRSMESALWAKWAPCVVDFHGLHGADADDEPHRKIARLCLEKAPDAVVDGIRRIILGELASSQFLVLPNLIDWTWSSSIEALFVNLVRDDSVSAKVLLPLLETLLKHGSPEGTAEAKKMLALPIPIAEDK